MQGNAMQGFRLTGMVVAWGLLAGCTSPQLLLPAPLQTASAQGPNADVLQSQAAGQEGAKPLGVERMPPPPSLPGSTGANLTSTVVAVAPQERNKPKIDINFEQVPLPALIGAVYGEMLGRVVSMDDKVAQRRDLVTFRTPVAQTREQVRDAMALLLKSYGVAVVELGTLVRVIPDAMDSGYLPEIRRGAALPETPPSLRPIFQIVPLGAVRNTEVASWLKSMFKDRLVIQEDAGRNAILLSGLSDTVAAAMQAIQVLDQPVMAGRTSLRLTPTFWAAEELAKRLGEILAAEGYAVPPANYVPSSGGVRYPIMLLPLPGQNSVLVFAQNDEYLSHVARWAEKLDQPSERTTGRGLFMYTAQNLSATELAKTLDQLFDGGGRAAPAGATAGKEGPAGAGTSAGASVGSSGKVVVDSTSNTLIFRTNPEEYSQMINILRSLDKPPKAALVEVTVAELTLKDDNQFGLEWLLKNVGSSGSGVVGGTLGGLAIGSGGLTVQRLVSGGDVRVILNALASTNQANVLSSPRIMARNGETATIQVGQEVPLITSQQSSINNANPDNVGILQTVQYRNTGVILKVKPVIHSGNRVDLEVVQEVSAAQNTVTGVNNSPTISTRKLETKMTLQSGSTVLLGGLISNDTSKGDAGIPGLKDVPVLGSLFGVQKNNTAKTELVVLITPYVMNDDNDALAVTKSFKDMLPWLSQAEPVPAAVPVPVPVQAPLPAHENQPKNADDAPSAAGVAGAAGTAGAVPSVDKKINKFTENKI